MAESTYFVQECPTCGRNLRIRVEYLGRSVVCQHCQGPLVARDGPHACQRGINLLQRAEALIGSAPERFSRPR